MAALAALAGGAASAVGSIPSGLMNIGNNVYSQGQANERQQRQLDFDKWSIQNRERAFTSQGLPSLMAYGGSMPRAQTHMGGNAYMDTGFVGQKFNSQNTPIQQYNGYGRALRSDEKIPISKHTSRQDFVPPDGPGAQGGQNDRLGLGNGRYSSVEPPETYTNNWWGGPTPDRFNSMTFRSR